MASSSWQQHVPAAASHVCPALQILANCATLAMYSHQPGFDDTQLGQALGCTDIVFAACFSAELLLKVLAMGLVAGPGTYLRSGECSKPFQLCHGWSGEVTTTASQLSGLFDNTGSCCPSL
jgi:hypothetical protein